MKIHNIFFDILCDVYYHLVKFEFKIGPATWALRFSQLFS